MRIAVTGGSGRIGRAVVALALAQGHTVVNIDRVQPSYNDTRPDLTFVEADIADYDALERAMRGCDGLVHLAAIPAPGRHPDHVVHNNNVTSSYNAVRAAVELGIFQVCQASSINAIGGAYSRWPRYDYFPLDERHPSYAEDPYSLSKWICEQQAGAIVRLHEGMRIASLRFHGVAPGRRTAAESRGTRGEMGVKHLWGYTLLDAAARACLQALEADFRGHETFYIVAPETTVETPSLELKQRYFPDVPLRADLSGHRGFFDCSKAASLLGWRHDQP